MVLALAAVVTQCNHAELIGRIPWRRRGPARPGRRIRDDSLRASLAAARWLPGISGCVVLLRVNVCPVPASDSCVADINNITSMHRVLRRASPRINRFLAITRRISCGCNAPSRNGC